MLRNRLEGYFVDHFTLFFVKLLSPFDRKRQFLCSITELRALFHDLARE
jgi:hypothetical protein